jgi:hypothetical protein
MYPDGLSGTRLLGAPGYEIISITQERRFAEVRR